MTDSQQKVLTWLEHQRKGSTSWYRPSQIQPDGYPGGPSAIGKVLRSLLALGAVEVRKGDRGNGTTVAEYRAAPPKKQLEIDSSPKNKLETLKAAAEYFDSGFASLVCRDDKGKLLSVSVYATGKKALALVRWLERPTESAGVPSKSTSAGRGPQKGAH
jgi:hypothetical protein